MSGSLFSSEVVGRALMFLLIQPSITISHRNLYRPLVQVQDKIWSESVKKRFQKRLVNVRPTIGTDFVLAD